MLFGHSNRLTKIRIDQKYTMQIDRKYYFSLPLAKDSFQIWSTRISLIMTLVWLVRLG